MLATALRLFSCFHVFHQVIVGLWILSGVGSCCDFLTLIYIGMIFERARRFCRTCDIPFFFL